MCSCWYYVLQETSGNRCLTVRNVVVIISVQYSKTLWPPSLSPSLSGVRRKSLGTVCAESCRYGTMTGWTKLTTNEITLQERLTPSGFGAAPGAPRHFGTQGLWQASFGPPSASRIYWACWAIANTLAQTGTGNRFQHVLLQTCSSVFLFMI